MAAATETRVRPDVLMYETYADIETAEGYQAWNAGQYQRAVKLWCSAARWTQFARAAREAM
jgi:hypothetical protein